MSSGRMLVGNERRCCTRLGRVLVQREGADTRVLAVGGVTGGLPPVPILIGLMSVWSSKARCCAFVLTKAGGIGGRHAPAMPAVRDPSCLGPTFELRGLQRQDALARTEKMYRVPQAGPWWPAVGAPLERGVRPHCAALDEGFEARCDSTPSAPQVRAAQGARFGC